MTEEDNEYIWHVTRLLGETLPGVGFGYNSYGAGASVNHLHFQMFLRDKPLPVAHERWQHNGGGEVYPAQCYRFDSPDTAWKILAALHQVETTYNLVYLPGSGLLHAA
ncbi:hypothetical protein BOW51_08600 [Solemya velesiana gill symbiont]|uniref:Uncharacterized protein n=1 Tax=Solemya velesiana gill symbiont TaxID=1918948 RepID=A0A1T2KTG8_9GAMM|nr:hypothetical protein BOW51_08600 [Solemya velesiana gill symbiont]